MQSHRPRVMRTDDSTERIRNNMKNYEHLINERLERMRVVMATSKIVAFHAAA